MKLLAKYKNGNYTVRLFDDGTKIRFNTLDNLTPSFAESMDVTITTKCNGGCPFCYLGCNDFGIHADLTNPIFDTVHPGTEMAINANDLSHPGLEEFLIKMKDKGVFVSMTINQMHLIPNLDKLKDWQDRRLIWGIGISLTNSKDPKLVEATKALRNTVLHVIDGCFTKEDIENLAGNDLKLLILGFKHKGRGLDYYEAHKEEVDANIEFLRNHLYDYKDQYDGFGFDGLANEDLHIRELVGEKNWAKYHMGNEGEFTMYISATDNTYAISSMDVDNIYPIKEDDTVDTIFKHIRYLSGFKD